MTDRCPSKGLPVGRRGVTRRDRNAETFLRLVLIPQMTEPSEPKPSPQPDRAPTAAPPAGQRSDAPPRA